ncbi:hypothetical protein [Okeania sp. KiyG1]|uniref:hypothetical protein n=1 Tax=Okeania sp. KiyG1 TaxID=2720165 RepID=UPI0035C91825
MWIYPKWGWTNHRIQGVSTPGDVKAFTNFLVDGLNIPTLRKNVWGGSAEFTKSAFKWKDGQVYLAIGL